MLDTQFRIYSRSYLPYTWPFFLPGLVCNNYCILQLTTYNLFSFYPTSLWSKKLYVCRTTEILESCIDRSLQSQRTSHLQSILNFKLKKGYFCTPSRAQISAECGILVLRGHTKVPLFNLKLNIDHSLLALWACKLRSNLDSQFSVGVLIVPPQRARILHLLWVSDVRSPSGIDWYESL